MTTPTSAARVRAHVQRYPDLTPAERARKLGVPDEVVRSTLRRSASRGRPPKDCTTITLVVTRKLLEYARAAAAAEGVGLDDWIRSTLATDAVPEAEWPAYWDHEKAAFSRTSKNRTKRTKNA